ncbi:MAG: PAS domain S-box protein [bacterium]
MLKEYLTIFPEIINVGLVTSKDGNIINVNSQFCDFMNSSYHNFIGKSLIEFIPLPVYVNNSNLSLINISTLRELELIKSDGAIFCCKVVSIQITINSSLYTISIVANINFCNKSSTFSNSPEFIFSDLLNHPIAVYQLSQTDKGDLIFDFVNDYFESWFSVKLNKLIGSPLTLKDPMNLQENIYSTIINICESPVKHHFFFNSYSLDNKHVFLHFIIPLYNPVSRHTCLLGIVFNSSDLHHNPIFSGIYCNQYKTLVENSTDIIARYSPAGRIIYVNKITEKIFGNKVKDVFGKTPVEIADTNDMKIIYENILKAASTGKTIEYDLDVDVINSNTPIYHNVKTIPEFDENNSLISVLVIGRDISAQINAQRNLKLLVYNIPDIVTRYNKQNQLIYENSFMTDKFDKTEDQIIRKRFNDLITKNKSIKGYELQKAIQLVFNTGKPNSLIFSDWSSEAGRLYFEVRFIPEFSDGGNVISVLSLTRDITLLKQTEINLENSEQKFRSLIENSPDNIISYNLSGIAIIANKAVLDLLNVSADQLIGNPVLKAKILDTDGFNEYENKLLEVLNTGKSGKVTVKVPIQKNNIKTHEVVFNPNFDKEGKVIGATAFGRDVTPYVEIQEKLCLLNHKLTALSSCSQVLLRTEDEDTLIKEICRIIHTDGGYPLVCITYPHQGSNTIFKSAAGTGVGYNLIKDIDIVLPSKGDIVTLISSEQNFYSDQIICIYNLHEKISPLSWINDIAAFGYKTGIILPLYTINKNLIGSLLLFSNDIDIISESEKILLKKLAGDLAFGISMLRTKLKLKSIELERIEHLAFLKNMDKINQVIQGTRDFEEMMNSVLEVVLNIYDCDRVFLVYPCDPNAKECSVPIEITKPEFPGASKFKNIIKIDNEVADSFRVLLSSDFPVKFGTGTGNDLPNNISNRFGFKSFIATALYPKHDLPWEFGLHQCSYARKWTLSEEKLLHEIGFRLTDALTGIISYNNLLESEKKYKQIFDNASEGIFFLEVTEDGNYRNIDVNREFEKYTGILREQLIGKTINETVPTNTALIAKQNYDKCVKTGIVNDYEVEFSLPTGNKIFHTILTPLKNTLGNIYRIIGITRDITEKRVTERKLFIKVKEYHTLIENIPTMIVRYDTNLHRTYVNPAWEKLSGLSAQEVVGIDIHKIPKVFPATNKEYVAKLKETLNTGVIRTAEFVWTNTLGIELFLQYIIVPEFDLHGKIVGLLSAGHDITELKQVGQMLNRQKDYLNSLLNTLTDVVVDVRMPERIIEYANKSTERVLGFNLADIVGKTTQIYFKDNNDFFNYEMQIYEAIKNGIDEIHVEQEFKRKDGSFIWAEVHSKLILDKHNQVERNISIIRDISDRKNAEEKLRILTRGIEQSPVVIMVADKEGKIVYLNPKFETVTGYKIDEIIGKNMAIIKQNFENYEEYETIMNTIAAGNEWIGKALNRKKNNELFWQSGIVSPIKNDKGQITHYLGILEDITEKIKAENELVVYRKGLEELVQTRTTELDKVNALLKKEIAKQKEINDLRARFISLASHEFRTPLTTIFSSAQLLEKYGQKWDKKLYFEQLKNIQDYVHYLIDIIDDTLIISQANDKKLNFHPAYLNLKELCGKFLLDIKVLLTPKHLLISNFKLKRNNYLIDEKLLKYIITNLLSNAIKYTPNGGNIEFNVYENKTKLFFVVKDNGIGISDYDKIHIFESFYRGKNIGDIKGTGLGLSIIKKAVEIHNGKIKLESELEQGSTFTISFSLKSL